MSKNLKIGLGVVVVVVVYFVLSAFTAMPAQGQQQTGQYVGASSEVFEAAAAGQEAGASKSVAMTYVATGATSMMFPGVGLVYLLFLNTGEVEPNFSEQTFLRDKSPEYVATWTHEYDRALTAKQKRAVFIGTGVGSAITVALIAMVASSF